MDPGRRGEENPEASDVGECKQSRNKVKSDEVVEEARHESLQVLDVWRMFSVGQKRTQSVRFGNKRVGHGEVEDAVGEGPEAKEEKEWAC